MSSRKQGTVFWACKDSSLKCGNKQLYSSACLQCATRQHKLLLKATILPEHTPAQPAGHSQPGSLQPSTGTQVQRAKRTPPEGAGNRTADSIYWGKGCGRSRGGWDTSFWGCHQTNVRLGLWRDEEQDVDLLWDRLPEGGELLLLVLAHEAVSFAITLPLPNSLSGRPTE